MTVVLLSGGLDSTVLLTDALLTDKAEGGEVTALSFLYGQKHSRELEAARQAAALLEVPHVVVDVAGLGAILPSALTTADHPVPDGHYADEVMRQTVVPNRNAILLMIAAGYAAAHGHTTVATAVHAGDHPIYPDCRPEFIEAASHASRLGTAGHGDVEVIAPFVDLTKIEIVLRGHRLAAPMSLSWSCYKGGDLQCGTCGTCVERREAFFVADVRDHTRYANEPGDL